MYQMKCYLIPNDCISSCSIKYYVVEMTNGWSRESPVLMFLLNIILFFLIAVWLSRWAKTFFLFFQIIIKANEKRCKENHLRKPVLLGHTMFNKYSVTWISIHSTLIAQCYLCIMYLHNVHSAKGKRSSFDSCDCIRFHSMENVSLYFCAKSRHFFSSLAHPSHNNKVLK